MRKTATEKKVHTQILGKRMNWTKKKTIAGRSLIEHRNSKEGKTNAEGKFSKSVFKLV